MLWCHAIVDDVGDHLMPEQSVLCSPDDLCRICRRLMNYATLRTMNFSTRLCDCQTTSSIHYCRHRLLHHNITICENAHIHCRCSYLNILLTCQIIISSHTCCIKHLLGPLFRYCIIGLDWKYYSIVTLYLCICIILLLGLRSGMPLINEY